MEPEPVSGLRSTSSKNSAMDFELWIRMATDNKINAKNSWNFALIDYFHDLSLLKEGTSINFQKASATLDGCVKIYSSRVDSAATETGKLLSGLVASNTNPFNYGDEYDSEDNEKAIETVEEDNIAKSRRKNTVLQSTLAKSFEEVRAKKVELELTVDPSFKKALADFDEDGSKSLLLNILNIDSSGRILFDTTSIEISSSGIETGKSSDTAASEDCDMMNNPDEDVPPSSINFLENMLFGDSDDLDNLHVCPSMNAIQEIVENGVDKNNIFDQFNQEQLNEEDDDKLNEAFNNFYDDYDNGASNGIRVGDNSVNVTLQKLFDETIQKEQKEKEGIEEVSNLPDYDLLAYFDKTIKRNWGQTQRHWKVLNLLRKQKQSSKKELVTLLPKKREFKVINFLDDEDEDEDELFVEPVASSLLPKNHRRDESRHCLPDDIDFTAKRLIRLFTKPTILKTFNKRRLVPFSEERHDDVEDVPANENYWSQKYQENEELERSRRMDDILKEDLQELHQSYNQSFFQDDEYYDDNLDPMEGGNINGIPSSQVVGSQMFNSKYFIRPTYINFSKVAKRVDIKLLKDKLWNCLKDDLANQNPDDMGDKSKENDETIGNSKISDAQSSSKDQSSNVLTQGSQTQIEGKPNIKFSKIINDLTKKYSKEERNDLSTSFCFICLLHLANENGFTIENNIDNTDLLIAN